MRDHSSPLIIITHEFYPKRGGIATFVEEIAGAAARAGRNVTVWAQSASLGADDKPWPFRLRRLGLRGTHNFICQFRLARELVRQRRTLRHSLVYLAEPGPMYAFMWLQFSRGFLPPHILLTFHGSEILKFHRNPLIRPFARRLIRHAERISTLTQFTNDLLCRHFPEAIGKTCLTPGALRDDFGEIQTSLLTRDKIVILTVGRLHPRKGQLQTLRALQALPPLQRAQIEYWIVGVGNQGAYEAQLDQTANSADFRIRFMGDVPDNSLSAIYDQADIFALTSINHGVSIEGFGLVYLEASAHGLPVIAHDIGGVSEAVSADETGLLVSPDDPAALTAAFSRLIADSALRRRLGEAGRPWSRRHTWKRSAELLFGPSSPESPS